MKKIVKIALCNFIYYSRLLWLYVFFAWLGRKNFPLVVINFHRFVENYDGQMDTEPTVVHKIADFKREIKFLLKYFDIISLDQAVETLRLGQGFSRPTVSITVDDGFADNFTLLFPVLSLHKVPVTIFLTTGVIGTKDKIWVDRLADLFLNTQKTAMVMKVGMSEKRYGLTTLDEKREAYSGVLSELKDVEFAERNRLLGSLEQKLGAAPEDHRAIMLDWEQVRMMSRQGISFGAHTMTHPILTNMPLQDAKREILGSKEAIEKNIGIKVRHFAYPNGRPQDFNEELRSYCKEIGFESISTCDFGNNKSAEDALRLKRIGSYLPLSVFAVNVVRCFK